MVSYGVGLKAKLAVRTHQTAACPLSPSPRAASNTPSCLVYNSDMIEETETAGVLDG